MGKSNSMMRALPCAVFLVGALALSPVLLGADTGAAGSSQAATTMQPVLAMQYIIATAGIFPGAEGEGAPVAGGEQSVGEVRLFAGTFVPSGWMACNGQ